MTNPVAYAAVRVGLPEHHMVSGVYRDEWAGLPIARMTGDAAAYGLVVELAR